ncbi:HAD family hydrolase [Planctobacterium marinum]|uniref:Phosphatase n=1 Tax=Planctobacterium marinum TaxID=1631968 RepID=A0AA48HHF4_9ALTE|nr:phosphatase [Planctobacterium marinum]
MVQQAIKGVIFDMDGTLVTSELDFAAMREAIGCPAEQDILDFIATLNCEEAREQAEQTIIDIEVAEAEHCQLIDGVPEMLKTLQQWQVPVALVTRNCRAATAIKLAKAELQFDPVLTRECAPAKPDPSALLQVANSWQIAPEHLLYVGDYLHDIHAAENASMRSMLVALQGTPDWKHNATWQCNDYTRFLDILSPLVTKSH